MDLMTLAAKIVLDDSSFNKGINRAEQMGQQLQGKMSAMTVAVGNLAADAVRKAVSAVGDVVSGAIDGYANYEQLIGGVETLFKSSADKVAKYAKQSYKTTGLSANDYMETITSFSASLLQGLKGDTEKAADVANTAVTDMADNANKMGTDIGSIQTAYQGFAKQNYTMLDNLKLGYGGTKEEMVRLINDSGILDKKIKNLDGITFDQIIEAIHKIQEQMGITGTTAEEAAKTISGSKASLKSAWDDFLSAVAGEGGQRRLNETAGNFQEAFTTYVNNLAPVLQTAVENAPTLITAVVNGITSIPSKAVTRLAEGGLGALTAIFSGGAKLANWFIDGLVEMFKNINADQSQIAELGNTIGEFIGSSLSNIIENAPTIISGLFTAGVTLASSLIEGLFTGLFGGNEIDKLGDEMNDSIEEANVSALKADSILKYMEDLYEKYGSGVTKTEEFKAAQEELSKYLGDKAGEAFINYGSDIQGAIDHLQELSKQLRKTAILDAMRKNNTQLYELLGEKQSEMALSEVRMGIAQSTVENYPNLLKENITAYAGALLKENVGRNILTKEQWDRYKAMSEGYDLDTGKKFDEMSLDELSSSFSLISEVLKGFYDTNNIEDKDRIWEKNRADNIFSVDEMNAMAESVKTAQTVIDQETEAQKKLTEEIAAVNEQITISEQAIQSTATKLAEDALSVDSAGDALAGALSGAAAKISALRPSFRTPHYIEEATGVDNIPFNGFRASLHKGEMILTKREADEYRNGGGNAAVVGAIQELRQDMQNLKIVVGRKTFGQAVVDYGGARTREYLSDYEDRMYSGYGT